MPVSVVVVSEQKRNPLSVQQTVSHSKHEHSCKQHTRRTQTLQEISVSKNGKSEWVNKERVREAREYKRAGEEARSDERSAHTRLGHRAAGLCLQNGVESVGREGECSASRQEKKTGHPRLAKLGLVVSKDALSGAYGKGY